MNILFIGSTGLLSLQPFKVLLSSKHTIVGLGLSTRENLTLNNIPICNAISQADTIEGIALNAGIPVFNLFNFKLHTIELLESLQIDIIYVSCFAYRLPQQLLSIPRLGCYNVHPSFLPGYRGPAPLFWQLRDGLHVIGVSLHRVTIDIDAGPVVAQQSLRLEPGSDNAEITRGVAQTAGNLLLSHLLAVEKGEVVEIPQNEAVASYQSFPVEKDFYLDEHWSNLHCYNFICATRHWGSHYYLLDDVVYQISGEIRYMKTNIPETVAKTVDNQKKVITLVSNTDKLIAQFE